MTPQRTGPEEVRLVVAVALATMLAPLNSTMIAVALPPIAARFGAGASVPWLVTGYLIAMASLQPVAGKLGDRFGRRPLMLGGLALFALASLGAALAPGFGWLLAMRVLQGVAGAIAFPNGAAMLREAVPDARRGARFGLVGAGAGLAAAVGPPLAGVLVWSGGWQTIFYVNVLLIAPAAWLGWRAFPRGRTRPAGSPPAPFDLAGAVLLCIALIAAAAMLTHHGPLGAWARLGWPVAAGAAVLFAVVEWRHPDPAVQLRLFGRRAFAAANASVAASNFAMYVTLLSVPLLLAARAGSSAGAGAVLAAMSGAMFLASPVGGSLADRWGRRRPALLGLGLLLAGTLLLATAGSGISIARLVGALMLIGLGIGTGTAALQTTAVESVAARDAGMASGVYTTSRYLGSIVGSALLARLAAGSGTAAAPATVGTAFMGPVFIMVAGAAVLALVAAFGLRERPAASRPDATLAAEGAVAAER
ncbi:MAG: MFS transporter [Deinococcales bacterium]